MLFEYDKNKIGQSVKALEQWLAEHFTVNQNELGNVSHAGANEEDVVDILACNIDNDMTAETAYQIAQASLLCFSLEERVSQSGFYKEYIHSLSDDVAHKAKLVALNQADFLEEVEHAVEFATYELFENEPEICEQIVSYDGQNENFVIQLNGQNITNSKDFDKALFDMLNSEKLSFLDNVIEQLSSMPNVVAFWQQNNLMPSAPTYTIK